MKIKATILFFTIWIFICWYGGLDWFTRGIPQAYFFTCGILGSILTYACPCIKNK